MTIQPWQVPLAVMAVIIMLTGLEWLWNRNGSPDGHRPDPPSSTDAVTGGRRSRPTLAGVTARHVAIGVLALLATGGAVLSLGANLAESVVGVFTGIATLLAVIMLGESRTGAKGGKAGTGPADPSRPADLPGQRDTPRAADPADRDHADARPADQDHTDAGRG